MNIEIFYHMFCIEGCIELFSKSYAKIKTSGLLDCCNNVHVVMVGEQHAYYAKQLMTLEKIRPYFRENKSGEMDSIDLIHTFCQSAPETHALYIHSKGATRQNNPNVKAWVDYMEYFLIENYQDCIKELKEYDAVGVDFHPTPMKHYAGNFWWANSYYIKQRSNFAESLYNSKEITDPRWYCEFWLLDNDNVKSKSLHQSNVDLYVNEYKLEFYKYKNEHTPNCS